MGDKKMEQTRKSVNVKATNRKKHTFEVETVKTNGLTFCYLKKNGNIILNTTPKELLKLKLLFE
jgi:hypothetical protein